MLNKKAIAAFAAGATLLSGLAFAAPSFAAGENKADTAAVDSTPKAVRIKELKEQIPMVEKEKNALENGDEGVAYGTETLYAGKVAEELGKAEDALQAGNAAVNSASANYDAAHALFNAAAEGNAAKDFTKDTTVKFKLDKGVIKKDNSGDLTGESLNKALETAQTKYSEAQDALSKATAKRDAFNARYQEVAGEYNKLKAELAKLEGKTPTPTPTPSKVDYKADVKFLNDFRKNPKSAAADVKAANEALAKLAAAKKAKDKAAMKAALKEIHALAEALRNKKVPPTPKDDGPALKSLFGSDILYTNYKGLAADLVKRGITNIGAYDALLDKLEFGLKRFGWENIIKNFPEHTEHNLCDFLAGLRRHLTKALKHYEHVEAAVKDMIAELNEDKKDALATENYEAAKVIKEKLALANGLLKVADNNRTRAAALLNSANDHAKDFSCDTAAKEVRAAMDKEPNSPFKKHGQKNDAKKPNAHKPNGGASAGSHKLGKTGATVALVAVAASVLAGMGAALRKIRH